LDRTAEAMLAQLEQANVAQVARTGMAMTGAEMQAFLRELIERDRLAWLKRRAWQRGHGGPTGAEPPAVLFHDTFRAAH
ncbi:MAG TPA: hypothetical protein VIH23_04520, partial [Burkholderiales bacterium]